MKENIILARKIVPNFWEVNCVDGPLENHNWVAVQYSSANSWPDIARRFGASATVIDVTAHFLPDQPSNSILPPAL